MTSEEALEIYNAVLLTEHATRMLEKLQTVPFDEKCCEITTNINCHEANHPIFRIIIPRSMAVIYKKRLEELFEKLIQEKKAFVKQFPRKGEQL
jgi:hypothetical protein